MEALVVLTVLCILVGAFLARYSCGYVPAKKKPGLSRVEARYVDPDVAQAYLNAERDHESQDIFSIARQQSQS